MMPRSTSFSEICTPNRCGFSLRDDRQILVVNSSTQCKLVKRNSVECGLDLLVSVILEKKTDLAILIDMQTPLLFQKWPIFFVPKDAQSSEIYPKINLN